MDELKIDGNPAWVDDDSADGDLTLSAFKHGGSVASITLDVFPHDGSPKTTVGVELTRCDCEHLAIRLRSIISSGSG